MAKSIYDDDDNVSLIIDDETDVFNLPNIFNDDEVIKDKPSKTKGENVNLNDVPKGDTIIDRTKEIEASINTKQPKKTKPVKEEKEVVDEQDKEDDLIPIDDDDIPVDDNKNKKIEKPTKKVEESVSEIDYNAVLKRLKDDEIITTDLPENIETDEDLLNVFKNEAIAYKNDYHSYMDNKYNGLLTYLEEGGNALEFFKTVQENKYDEIDFSKIKDDQQSLEKAYIDFYKSKDMDDEDIMRNMKRAKDLEEFDNEVEKIYPKLQKQSKQQKESLAKEAKEKEKKRVEQEKILYNNISNEILKSEELIPTIKLNDKDKKAITRLATTNDVFEKLAKDPVKSRVLLAALDHYGIFDGDWKKILNTIETKTTKQVKSQFLKNPSKGSETNKELTDDNDDLGSKIAKSYIKSFGRK